MAVHGRRHNRIFHLVAIDHRKRRDAKPIELLGIYEPVPSTSTSTSTSRSAPFKSGTGIVDTFGLEGRGGSQQQACKTMRWSVDRIRYWLGVGAVPSEPVERLLKWVRPPPLFLFSACSKVVMRCQGGILPADAKSLSGSSSSGVAATESSR